jgi:hypothetical protein
MSAEDFPCAGLISSLPQDSTAIVNFSKGGGVTVGVEVGIAAVATLVSISSGMTHAAFCQLITCRHAPVRTKRPWRAPWELSRKRVGGVFFQAVSWLIMLMGNGSTMPPRPYTDPPTHRLFVPIQAGR